MRYKYPFVAVVGQEKLKKGIALNLINPKIGGILINGEKGVAKSTLIRSIENITTKKVINVPLNITEDMLLGSIDLEKTIEYGKVNFEVGILGKANKNILYVDEVNLLGDNIVDCLLDVSASKVNKIEREGISHVEESDFILVGSMNREMGDLRSEFLDRFPLYIDVKGSREPEMRVEIIKRILEFEKDPVTFIKSYEDEEKNLVSIIKKATEFLKDVKVSEKNLEKIVKMCIDYGVKGHRADIIIEQTAKAIAALAFSTEITDEYIEEAASYVLPHRATKMPDDEDKEEDDENQESDEDSEDESENKDEDANDDENSDNDEKSQEHNPNEENNHNQEEEDTQEQEEESEEKPIDESENDRDEDIKSEGSKETQIFAVGQDFKIKEFAHKKDRVYRSGKGKRSKTKAQNKLGQYLYSTQDYKDNDIAFDATIRAAAPFQRSREKNGMALALRKSDLRGKVRQKKVSNLIVLVVDSSGSIGVNQRMIQVKGAILSMLKDSYVKRDKVALVLFRGEEAEVVLPPTNSVERAYKLLSEFKTGGKTPLNDGLLKGFEVITKEIRKDETIMPMFVVISDGKGNVPINKDEKSKDELIKLANSISEVRQINSLVIDVEKKGGMMTFDRAKLLADNMAADYLALENLKSDDIISNINKRRKNDE
ncbi:MAG: VWA domain-containing protein [Sarcina sp.]